MKFLIAFVASTSAYRIHSHAQFASGYNDDDLDAGEKMGIDVGLGDHDITGYKGHGVEPGFFDVHVAQKQSRAQLSRKFAEGMSDDEDVGEHLHMYNWDAAHNGAEEHRKKYRFVQIDPVNPTGLEPAPSDPQHDDVYQARAPLIWENWRDSNDWKKVYNGDKHQNHLGNYAQMNQAMLHQFVQVDAEF